jgi:hypothetical protein
MPQHARSGQSHFPSVTSVTMRASTPADRLRKLGDDWDEHVAIL